MNHVHDQTNNLKSVKVGWGISLTAKGSLRTVDLVQLSSSSGQFLSLWIYSFHCGSVSFCIIQHSRNWWAILETEARHTPLVLAAPQICVSFTQRPPHRRVSKEWRTSSLCSPLRHLSPLKPLNPSFPPSLCDQISQERSFESIMTRLRSW